MDINLTEDQKDQMLSWVQQAQRPVRPAEQRNAPLPAALPWWERCNEDQRPAARAFVAEFLPHLLAGA